MYRRGRPEDQSFDPTDAVYRACTAEDVQDGRLLSPRIKFRNWSVNWSRYSEPGDVLYVVTDADRVVRVFISDIPPSLQAPGGSVYEFRMRHRPDEDNYAHCELWTYKDSRIVEDPDPPATVKKKLRQMLSEKSAVIVEPPTSPAAPPAGK